MGREFTVGAWVFVAPHEGVNGKKTFGVSGQFLENAGGGKAVVALVNRDYQKQAPFETRGDGSIVVPIRFLSPKW